MKQKLTKNSASDIPMILSRRTAYQCFYFALRRRETMILLFVTTPQILQGSIQLWNQMIMVRMSPLLGWTSNDSFFWFSEGRKVKEGRIKIYCSGKSLGSDHGISLFLHWFLYQGRLNAEMPCIVRCTMLAQFQNHTMVIWSHSRHCFTNNCRSPNEPAFLIYQTGENSLFRSCRKQKFYRSVNWYSLHWFKGLLLAWIVRPVIFAWFLQLSNWTRTYMY